MEKKQVNRIFDPGDLKIAAAQHTELVNLAARIIRYQNFILDPAEPFFAVQLLRDQITRHGINWVTVLLARH